MTTPSARPPITLWTMMLFVVVAAMLCYNLKLVAVDYREDVIHIWRDWTGTHPHMSTPLRWSDTPGPPPTPSPRGQIP